MGLFVFAIRRFGMARGDLDSIPVYCTRYNYHHYWTELCKCDDQPHTCQFCIEQYYKKGDKCFEYHIPGIGEYLKHCGSFEDKAREIERARERFSAECAQWYDEEKAAGEMVDLIAEVFGSGVGARPLSSRKSSSRPRC